MHEPPRQRRLYALRFPDGRIGMRLFDNVVTPMWIARKRAGGFSGTWHQAEAAGWRVLEVTVVEGHWPTLRLVPAEAPHV